MKNVLILLVTLFSFSVSLAQRHEIGIWLGQPNLIADIGKTNYIQPFPDISSKQTISYSLGLLYRFNFNPQMGLRLNLDYNRVYFDDGKALEDYRVERNRRGNNGIGEGSIVFEYNFFDINDEQKFGSSPYIFAGLGAFVYKKRLYRFEHTLYEDGNGDPIPPASDDDFLTTVKYDEESTSGISIPFGVGYKFKVNYNWVISAEIGVRFTDSDNLDYSNETISDFQLDRTYTDPQLLADSQYYTVIQNRENNFISAQRTGNLNSNDWYVMSGISIAYAFGRPPCFCKNKN